MISPRRLTAVAFTAALALAPLTGCATESAATSASAPAFAATIANAGDVAAGQLSNARLGFSFTVDRGVLRGAKLTDKTTGRTLDLGEPFVIAMLVAPDDDASDEAPATIPVTVKAADFIAGAPVVTDIPAIANARRLIDRVPGKRVTVALAPRGDGLSAEWKVELREDAGYIRQTLTIKPLQFPAEVREVRLLDFTAGDAQVQGSVPGSPVTLGNIFAGVEHPMAENKVEKGRVTGVLKRKVPVGARRELTVSSILGVTAPGQLRREFQLGYINRERARPYEPLLNYNTWYDIGYFSRYDEKMATDAVRLYGEELVKKRGVKFDSFLFDDGWDDVKTLWQFNKGFPNEFRDLRKVAESYGAGPGVWFSPWGGYGQPKDDRIAAANLGRDKGKLYETNKTGFALSGRNYYKLFRDMCLRMIRDNGINHFKFDGTGDAGSVQPGSAFGSDFEAIIALIADLRKEKPDIYINLTTGTWASPFWFGTADSIWRGSFDHEFCGIGTPRQKWITFRDGMTYKYNVAAAPLFPINSLMLHGVIYAKGARDLNTDPAGDLPDEIWSGFGTGTQMEELYATPSLLSQKNWDDLAAAAKWARANQTTLVDTHWIGGDPVKLEVYGWASWSPEKGILTLRNPSDREQTFTADPAALFELPLGAATRYTLASPKGDKLPGDGTLTAGKPASFTLKPFEVLVLEAAPAK